MAKKMAPVQEAIRVSTSRTFDYSGLPVVDMPSMQHRAASCHLHSSGARIRFSRSLY